MSLATSSAAAVPETAAHAHDQNQYLTFMLGREVLAIGILSIKEILEYEPPTEVPMMPSFIRGVINLRGAVVPVVDLATRLNRTSAPISKKTCVVIVESKNHGNSQVIGIIVDVVNEVLEIATSQIEAPPDFGTSGATAYIAGLGKVNGKFVIILEVDRLLSIEELNGIEHSAQAAGATQ
jgi:purine-binding chemotaxis protein CheW